MKILIVGGYPPPIGGNAVHVQRLRELLSDVSSQVKVLDIDSSKRETAGKPDEVIVLSENLALKFFEIIKLAIHTTRDTIIHFHLSRLIRFKWVALFLFFVFPTQPKIVTIHSGRFENQTKARFMRVYLKGLLGHFSKVITVTSEQSDYLVRLGIPAEKLITIPAFLPQKPNQQLIPPSISSQIGKKKIVLTSGILIPLYNYDILIDCITRLNSNDYFFVFAFYNKSDPIYEDHIYQRLSGLSNAVILRDQPADVFVSIVSICDIYVRSTSYDGDAVSIREALYFGKTIFASDCVKRPSGCQLFSLSDEDGLYKLFQLHQVGDLSQEKVFESNFNKILEVYRSVQR